MTPRILVPLDGSTLADRIVHQVKRLLVRKDYEVVLLTVVPDTRDAAVAERYRRDASDHLEGIRETLVGGGATATTQVVSGDPAREIVALAERLEPELVCMATHGRTGLSRLVRGSVAEQVLRGCPVPMLIANPWALAAGEELRFARILVPLDGSDASLEVLPPVEALARLYRSEVILLRIEPVASATPVLEPLAPVPPQLLPFPRSPKEIEAVLEPPRRRLQAAGIRTSVVGVLGDDVPEKVLFVAGHERVDLVAMSTHGRTGLARALLGSVTEAVLRSSEWPLLIVRPAGARSARAPTPAARASH